MMFLYIYKIADPLGLYLKHRSVYECTVMPLLPMPLMSTQDPERTDCHDPKARL